MIYVDTFEPEDICRWIGQVTEVNRLPLHQSGQADYSWFSIDGRSIQVERKQWPELLSTGIDDVEEQLGREIPNADETYLLVEGIGEPSPYGVDTYIKSENKPYYRKMFGHGSRQHPQPFLYDRIQAWFWRLDKIGVSVVHTSSPFATSVALVSYYKQSQKVEHQTLRRYIKPKISIKVRNPHVLSLMGIEGAGIGEIKALALVERFGNLYGVVNADVEELLGVDGIGKGIIRKLFTAVGRDV